MFKTVSSRVSFPDMEKGILEFWKDRDIFRRTETESEGRPLFMLYEGPPTANGSPGIHHVLARAFKDIIPRYKTMKGYRCVRKGGWDTHGLPVELEVEKELGFSTKRDIEEYGIEKFNQKCRESVFRYVKEWEEMTDRIGFWVDMDNPYVTLDNDYIETGWWILRSLWDKGRLYQDIKGAPHCPRCVTTLSSHEVALGYRENTPDPSVFVKFALETGAELSTKDGGKLNGADVPAFFLAWTTTPWTLPGNTALAVSPEAEYSVVEIEGEHGPERLIMASDLVEAVIPEPHTVAAVVQGSSLIGTAYAKLYDASRYGVEISSFQAADDGGTPTLQPVDDYQPKVFGADFVSMADGSGIVHVAPAFGDEDLNAGRRHGLAFVQQVDLHGTITGSYPFAGKFVKDADEDIMADLKERGLLYRRDIYKHTYPFCWRCDTPLLYYAKASWYIRTSAEKDRLISGNREINWRPDYIKEGRFGEWLRNNVDWAISRERFWGAPIPIWRCESCGHFHCVGSVRELQEMAVNMDTASWPTLDLHRPYVDRVAIGCPNCDGTMTRIPEVLDAWFDSGAMPFAQSHYPFDGEEALQDGRFPADYICEAVDQTRGWFYTLHALSTLIKGGPSYKNVICLGLILDAKGQKMSKSTGNVVDPWSVLDKHGADATRWYLYTASAHPGESRRFSGDLVGEAVRRFLLHPLERLLLLHHLRRGGQVPPQPDSSGMETPIGVGQVAPVRTELAGHRRGQGPGGIQSHRRGPPHPGLRRPPLKLVRAPEPPPLLEKRRRLGQAVGLRHPLHLPVHPVQAHGPLHALHRRRDVPELGPFRGPRRPGKRPPGRLSTGFSRIGGPGPDGRHTPRHAGVQAWEEAPGPGPA